MRHVLLALLIGILASAASVSAAPRLKVGVIAGFSGDWSAYGIAYRRGIELAHVGDRVQFVYEDDQFLSAKTVTAFRKLTSRDHVDAVIVGDTTTAAAVVPLAEKARIPVLVWAGDNEIFKNKRYSLRLWPTYEKELSFTADKVRAKYRNVAVMVSAHDYSSLWGRTLRAKLSGATHLQELSMDLEDYRSLIPRLKARGFDAVGLCLNPGQNGLFAAQMQQLGVALPLFGCNFLEATADLSKAREAFEGTWFVGTKLTPEFIARYSAAAGGTDHMISAAVHYDAALVLANAAGGGGELIERLMHFKPFKGAHTTVQAASDEGDQYLDFPVTAYEIKAGAIVERP